jgi:hypothetical protein
MVKLPTKVIRFRCVGASMSIQVKKFHAALKHGAYSATAVLPGEDLAGFKELHQKIIADLAPVGPLEDDIVGTITRLLWRKQNLATFRLAELAREYDAAIRREKAPSRMEFLETRICSTQDAAAMQAAEDQVRKELGDSYAWLKSAKP